MNEEKINEDNKIKKKIEINNQNKNIELKLNHDKYISDIEKIKKKYEKEIKDRENKYKNNEDKINNEIKLMNEKEYIIHKLKMDELYKKYNDLIDNLKYDEKIENMMYAEKIIEVIYNTYNSYNDNYYNSLNINSILLSYFKNDNINNTIIKRILNNRYEKIKNLISKKRDEENKKNKKRNDMMKISKINFELNNKNAENNHIKLVKKNEVSFNIINPEADDENPLIRNEKEAYCKLINKILANNQKAREKLPIAPKSNEIFQKLKDGIILCELINIAFPNTADERAIYKEPNLTKEEKLRNLNLCINSAKSIGCDIDITADDILDEEKQKILDLLYQILKIIVLKKVSIQYYPQLLRLKEDREEEEDLLMLGPEDFLKRWFNFHLKKDGHPNVVTNFSDDVKDSEKYTILIYQLDPSCDISSLRERDLVKRAEIILNNASKIGAKIYISAEDISKPNERLNTLFTAELFMAKNGMGEATAEEKMISNKLLDDEEELSREERSFRTDQLF